MTSVTLGASLVPAIFCLLNAQSLPVTLPAPQIDEIVGALDGTEYAVSVELSNLDGS